MPITLEKINQLHTIHVLMTGDISAQEMKTRFIEIYSGDLPADINAIWQCLDCDVEMDVMDVFELAKFTQSSREIEGYPATALVTNKAQMRLLCEEYITLVQEAPFEVELFDELDPAINWIKSRQKEPLSKRATESNFTY